jgi:hypothetical protein
MTQRTSQLMVRDEMRNSLTTVLLLARLDPAHALFRLHHVKRFELVH